MRKELLLRHIQGNASASEQEQVLQWIGRSEQNRQYYIDLKNLWVSQTLPDTRATEAELAQIRALTSRKPERKPLKIMTWLPTAIAAAAVLALVLVLAIPGRNDKVMYDFAGIPAAYKHTVYTESGVKSQVTLPDGTHVWLNSESKITFPDQFQGERREIEFSGEAYFEVAKDSLHPMRIYTNKGFDVEVLGTSFNLKCYGDDPTATATLYSGRIQLVSEGGQTLAVKPNEIVTVGEKKRTYSTIPSIQVRSARGAAIDNQSAWKNGRLVFEETPMDEVVKMLRRWHGVDIVVQDPGILKYRITAEFGAESISQIAGMLRYCARIDYRIEDNTVYFFSR